jgi:predicted transcriptional regulator
MDEQPDLNPRDEPLPDDAVGPGGGREERLVAIRAAVERGLEEIRAGRVTDLDAALDRIETMLDEIEAAKRG